MPAYHFGAMTVVRASYSAVQKSIGATNMCMECDTTIGKNDFSL